MKTVVIVGGGVVGLWCALRLARGGARVTVLEAESEARTVNSPTASAAAAGMLAPFDTESGPHQALALQSFDLWRAAHKGAAWADGVRFDGAIYISDSAENADALHACVVSAGRKARQLSPGQARKRLGLAADLSHALFVAEEGVADPLRVLNGLAYEAHRLGAVVRYNQDVAHIGGNVVQTHEGEAFEADIVVLAPGVWANDVLQAAAPALKLVRPAKGHLVAVATPRPLGATLHAPGFYLARRCEDTVLGATMEYDRYDRRPEPSEADKLLAKAAALLPGELAQTRHWAGVRPMSPDGWPMIGPSGGVLVAAGHSRNGWGLAPITAEIVAAYALNEPVAPEWAALSPARFAGR